MKIKLLMLLLVSFICTSKAQTTALDFTQNDCEGYPHHLFSELDSGYVVVMEFIMTCNACIAAGHALESMMADIETQYPGKLRFYQFAYTNTYDCTTMLGFKSTNAFSSSTFDQGQNMVAYYGGFGMPTVAIVAGQNHDVLYTALGMVASDTAQSGPTVRNFLASVKVNEIPDVVSFNTFPNPAGNILTAELDLKSSSTLVLQIEDFNGRLIQDVYNDRVAAGLFKTDVNVASLSPGIYLLKAVVNNKYTYSKIRIAR